MLRTARPQVFSVLFFTLVLALCSSIVAADNPLLAAVINRVISCETETNNRESYPRIKKPFDSDKDLLSLHYDFAPDRDDIHSAAADRTLLQYLYGEEWMCKRTLRVSGTYGNNAFMFIGDDANRTMESVWGVCGGYVDADRHILDLFFSWRVRPETLAAQAWLETLREGGDIWVKEGGQSDFTQKVLQMVRMKAPSLDTESRVHVVQHSQWNEDWTRDKYLSFVKKRTDYIRIPGANPVLCSQDSQRNQSFIFSASNHPVYAKFWRKAFDLFDPNQRLDFSDTAELLFILGWREGFVDIEEFKVLFLN